MIKLNSVIYNKMVLQAEEAVEQEKIALADGVLGAIGPASNDEDKEHSFSELDKEVYDNMWKSAVHVIAHYGLKSADIERVDEVIKNASEKFVLDVCRSLDIDESSFSILEPKVPGQY